MEKRLKILIVEDVETDAELIRMELEDSGMNFTMDRVEKKKALTDFLQKSIPDIIISDYSLPGFNALEALIIKAQFNSEIPFILVTGNQTEEIAVECIKKGADDYILKSSLTRLPSAIKNAIQKKQAQLASQQAIEQIKAREEKYRNLFENSLVGMFRADIKKCQLIEANEKAKEILGVASVEGLPLDNLRFGKESEALNRLLCEKKKIENFEAEIQRPNGTSAWISLSARLFEEEGIIEGVIHDITQSKNSYIELEKVNYELDRFTYHASHDLRSPLRSLEGLIKAAREQDGLEEIRTCLLMMEKSTVKLDNLINDLLTLAKSKKSEAKISSINFYRELQDCLSDYTAQSTAKGIKINNNVIQSSPFFSDAVRLRIILNNLISNAIKYHRIDQTNPTILINISATPDKVILTVEDNGKGIAEKHIHKIFDMFYRADSHSEGTGLGLYLVKITVEKLAGTIFIDSEVNKGTTFKIEIPNMEIQENSLVLDHLSLSK